MEGTWPELRLLRYFLAVAHEGSFTHAATRLSMAQPPLSHQIAMLEKMLGCQLFVRVARGAELTDAGRAFLPRAEAVLHMLNEAVREAREAAQGYAGTLRIAAVPTAASGIVASTFQSFHASNDKIVLDLRETPNPEQALDLLERGEVDIAITRAAMPRAGIEQTALVEEPLVLIVSSRHPLGQRGRDVEISELADESFVVFGVDSRASLPAAFVASCVRAGFNPRVVCAGAEFLTVGRLVESGMGVAILPRTTALLLVRLAITRLALTPFVSTSQLSVARRISRPVSPAAERFLAALAELLRLDAEETSAPPVTDIHARSGPHPS